MYVEGDELEMTLSNFIIDKNKKITLKDMTNIVNSKDVFSKFFPKATVIHLRNQMRYNVI